MFHSTIKCFIQLIFGLILHTTCSGQIIFVSPLGNDKNPGTKEKPLASFRQAQVLAGKIPSDQTVEVIFANGIYYLPRTVVFTAANNRRSLTFRAEEEGKAILSGGSLLQLKWKPYQNGIFVAEVSGNPVIDQLYINGKRQRMARFPNAVTGKSVFDTWDLSHQAKPDSANDPLTPERIARWKNPVGGYIHAMHSALWGDMHWIINGKNADGTLNYEGGWQNNRPSKMHPVYRMVENIFEELDAPGEWFYNVKEQKLYFLPEAGTNLATAKVEIVRLRHLIEFSGTKENPVRSIHLEGFVFRHAARTFMDNKEPLLRSDWTVYRGGAVVFNGAEDCSISDCEFDQVGGNTIFVNNYNRRITIRGCYIHHSGANGIAFVGDPATVRSPMFQYGNQDFSTIDRTPGPKGDNYPEDCLVEDCLITMTGRDEKQTAPVHISMSHKIRINHCSIYDVPRAGININEGTFGGHIIENCDIFNTVLETGDHGSFNSWGRDRYWTPDIRETVMEVAKDTGLPFLDMFEPNILRNSRWRCDHGWDIDLDDGSTNYQIYNNLLLNGGLKMREGYHRTATNNVIINNGLHPHAWYSNSGDVFKNNIVFKAYQPAVMDRANPRDGKWGKELDYNFYASARGVMTKFSVNGCDQNSSNGDPLFIEPAGCDFRVLENSPALKTGFVNFPMDQFGVTKASLKAIAKTPKIPNFTIQTEEASQQVVKQTYAWMNILLREPAGDELSAYGVSYDSGGVALTTVPEKSEAFRLGFRSGDLIQEINGTPIPTIQKLTEYILDQKNKNSKYQFMVIRNQGKVKITANLNLAEVASSVSPLQSSFIWTPAGNNPKGEYVVFRKNFDLKSPAKDAVLRIFADSRYLLWINGKYVLRGPCRFNPKGPEYDQTDVRSFLKEGKNSIVVLVHNYGSPLSGRIMKHNPGLTANLEIAGKVILKTDSTWLFNNQTRYISAHSWTTIPDIIDARIDKGEWMKSDFNDTSWPVARAIDGNQWGKLQQCQLPPQKETDVKNLKLLPSGESVSASLPVELTEGRAILVDFGQMAMAYTSMELDADAGSEMTMQYALRYKNGKPAEMYGGGNKYTACAGHQSFMTTDQWGSRYMLVKCVSGRIKISGMKITDRRYPFERIGRFNCSDPILNNLWEMAVKTIEVTTDDGYGSDARERNEWIQDASKPSYHTSRVALAGSGKDGKLVYSDPRLLKNMLRHAAQAQLPNGQFLATFPTDRGPEDCHYVIDDYSCQWFEALKMYWDATGDLDFLREMWPALTAQINWFLHHRTSKGLLLTREYASFDNPFAYITCEGATINAFFYDALMNSAAISVILGEARKSEEYKSEAEKLKIAFNEQFWNEKESAYNSAFYQDKWYPPTVHAQLIALHYGLVPETREAMVRKWFLANFKNPGMKHCCTNPDFEKMVDMKAGINMPVMYYWVFSELYRMDTEKQDQEVISEIRRRWTPMVKYQQDAGTLSESFTDEKGEGASESCHNYGAMPAYFLSSYVLGVRRVGQVKEKRILIEPRLADLQFAEGTVSTEFGPVQVSWYQSKDGKSLAFKFKIPRDVQAEIHVPKLADDATLTLNGHVLTKQGKPERGVVIEGRWIILQNISGDCKGNVKIN